MIIGLTGTICAGKQTIVDYLETKYGYKAYSFSDMLRDMMKKEGSRITRDTLVAFGNTLRKNEGAGILAKLLVDKLRENWKVNFVVDSIRHPEEVKILQSSPLFYLLAVDADLRVRFERCKARAREQDPQTMEAFVNKDQQELFGKGEQQRIRECMAMADELILNNGSVEELYAKLDALNITNENRIRPSWDDYFMRLAHLAAQRSNCMSRKVGAIIVKDKRVVSTGYNGTPKNVKNCNEGGCARCNKAVQKGTGLAECSCLHAEENAVIEAGRLRTEGSSIYSSFLPCLWCTKILIQAGIKEVIYAEGYELADSSKNLFEEAGVILRQMK